MELVRLLVFLYSQQVQMLKQLAQRGSLPLKLVDKVLTNSLEEFRSRALELAKRVDAFFMLNHDTLRDARGNHVDMLEVGRWYLNNIRIPEASHEDQFVLEGMLLTANDSGYNQGYLAVEMAHGILARGKDFRLSEIVEDLAGLGLAHRAGTNPSGSAA